MISHTVFRNRNNAIDLQLLSDDAPLLAPATIDEIALTLVPHQDRDALPLTVPDGEFIAYDNTDGSLVMQLGRVPEIIALDDAVYEVQVVAFGPENIEGVAFGSFLIYLTDWGGEAAS